MSNALYFYPRPPRGGRPDERRGRRNRKRISIHALREEGDAAASFGCSLSLNFYPRPPRGGRRPGSSRLSRRQYFYPRPPRGGRLLRLLSIKIFTGISIHALREEGDMFWPGRSCFDLLFLSTPSARRATRLAFLATAGVENFYPRPPRGGRQQKQRQNLYFLINYTTFCTNLEEP